MRRKKNHLNPSKSIPREGEIVSKIIKTMGAIKRKSNQERESKKPDKK